MRERSIGSPCAARSGRRSPRPPRASRGRAGRSSGSPRRSTSPCPTGRAGGRPSRPAGRGRARRAAASRSTIPPGMLGDVARQAGDLARQLRERAPARRAGCARRRGAASSSSATRLRVPAVGDAREPLELGERQAERLADVADRAARAVGREARDERGVLAAVALGDARRSASRGCRAGSRGRCRARRRARGSGSARARGRSPPDRRARGRSGSRRSSRRSCRARVRAAARGAASRARAPRARHSRASSSTSQWSRKKPARPSSAISASSSSSRVRGAAEQQSVARRVAVGERASQTGASCRIGRVGAVGEVGVAVAELLRQVELEPLGDLDRACDGVAVVGEALEHLGRREQDALVVAAPLALAAVERGAVADRDEHVLERRSPRVVRVDVAGRDGRHAERLGEVAQERRCGARRRARTAAGARRRSGPGRRRARAARRRSGRARRARGARSRRGRRALRSAPRAAPGRARAAAARAPAFGRVSRVRGGEQPAEVRVALRRLDEQRHVRSRPRASPRRR